MPECLNYMPWSSLRGLGTMAPDILHVGDYKDDKLKDGTPVQFRLIGLNHDVTKSGLVVPMTWEMIDCMPNRYPWERESGRYGPWPTTDLYHRMNDPNGDIYKLMPDAILEFAVPVLKLSVDVAEGEDKLIESEDKFFIKSEVEMFGRAIFSAPGEGHWYEWYRQENVPWHKMRNGNREYTMLRSQMKDDSSAFCVVDTNGNATSIYARYSGGLAPAFGF